MMNIHALNGLLGILTHTHRSLKESQDSKESLNNLKMKWALNILKRLQVDLEVTGNPSHQNSMLFVGNHISYLDIPLLLGTVDKISFVAKKELCRWPLFGKCARQLDTVFVKRNSSDSRNAAKQSIASAITQGKRVVIFPSGTTSISQNRQWKKGAFDIAASTDCLVQPFRISYEPLREVAYIDKDFFPMHLLKLMNTKTIQAKIEFHGPVKITNPIQDCLRWSDWSTPQNPPR